MAIEEITVEEMLVIITAIYVIITAGYVFLTALALSESKKQRKENRQSTWKMIKENRLQRMQDAELRTMLQDIDVTYGGNKHKIIVSFKGSHPIRNYNFLVKDSNGHEKKCESIKVNEWKKQGWQLLLHVDLQSFCGYIMALEKVKFYVNIRFESFLGRKWEYRFESADLLHHNVPEHKFVYAGEEPVIEGHEPEWFGLIDVIPPWRQKQRAK
jgi:hypothetical protein